MSPEEFDQLSDAEKFAHIKSLIIGLGPEYYERMHEGLKGIQDHLANEVVDPEDDVPQPEDTSAIDGPLGETIEAMHDAVVNKKVLDDGPDECAVPDTDKIASFGDDVKQDG